jgi:hypothetical protein
MFRSTCNLGQVPLRPLTGGRSGFPGKPGIRGPRVKRERSQTAGPLETVEGSTLTPGPIVEVMETRLR